MEARLVPRQGALLVANAISGLAALLDLSARLDRLHEQRVMKTVFHGAQTDVQSGAHFLICRASCARRSSRRFSGRRR